MRTAYLALIGATLLALTPVSGNAQDRRIHVNLGGGPTFNLGDLGDHFGTGWGPAIGITFDGPSQRVGFQFEYAYRWFDISSHAPLPTPLASGQFSANHQTHQFDFNLVANLTPPGSALRGYLVAGPGAYYRKVEITEYVGDGIICDPFWYVCGTLPVSQVIGSRGGWDFGFNVGAGVGLGLGAHAEFFVESRVHYVWGPKIQSTLPTTGATGGSANGLYWPLTFGVRF